MEERDMVRKLENSGSLMRGHFRLSSGRHSDTYIQCARLLRDPEVAVETGRSLAETIEGKADLVLCPALGAIVVGFTTALALGCDMVFAERAGGEMRLRRGFVIGSGDRVIIVEDVITTGGSVMELAALVEEAGAEVAGIACIVERGDFDSRGYPIYSIISLDAGSYPPGECPLCGEGVPIDSPGSRY